jgi:hypothetical protein
MPSRISLATPLTLLLAVAGCQPQQAGAIVPLEHNYLFNPHHPDFGAIRLGEATPFPIDPRLR